MEPIRYDTLGLGLTVNDGEADVLVTTGNEEQPVFVILTPAMAAQIGMGLIALSSEANVLQEHISGMSAEELSEYLTEAARRNARGLN